MRRSKTALKNQAKTIQKSSKIMIIRVQNQTPCRSPFLEPFGDHFGFILDPFWSRNRPESRPEDEKSLSGGVFKKALISDPTPAERRRQSDVLRRTLTGLPRSSPSANLARSAVNMQAGAVVAKKGALREGGSLRRTPDLPAVTEVTVPARRYLASIRASL